MSDNARKRLRRGLFARLFPKTKPVEVVEGNRRRHTEADQAPFAQGFVKVEKIFVKPGTEEPTGEREVVVQEEADLPGPNLVVTQARILMAAMAAGVANSPLDYIELGDPAVPNPPQLADTNLQQTTGQRKSFVPTQPQNTVQCVATWGAGEGNGFTYTEAGLFTGPTGSGTMFARKSGFSITKTNSFQLQFTWIIIFDVQDAQSAGCSGVSLIGSSGIVEDFIYTTVGGETEVSVPIDFTIGAKRLMVYYNGQRLIPPDQYNESTTGGGTAKGITLNGWSPIAGRKFYFYHLRW